MKHLLASILIVLLAGCSTTVPVKRNFPGVPEDMLATCVELGTIDPATTKLSEVVSVVSENYGKYQECKIKSDSWIEWYKTQKDIFESVK